MRLFACLLAIAFLGPVAAFAADSAPLDPIKPTQCGPGPAGAPCDGSGPASQGNSSGTDQGAGNPIHVITGNKYQQETDLPALPGVLGLEIVRHYNSALAGPDASPGILGRGWRLSYETDLYAIGNTLQIVQADGTRVIFIRDPKNPSQCATSDPARGTLAITRSARGEEYVWRWRNGRVLHFDHRGKLVQIKAPSGEFVALTRDPAGLLVKVTDPQGRSLVLGYPQRRSPEHFNGVTHIDSPVGRFAYRHGNDAPRGYRGNPRARLANLVGAVFPGGTSRRYHYEDAAHPAFLTGISVAAADSPMQRLSTYGYDSQGRGILSVRGEPERLGKDGQPVPGTGIEQVGLDFVSAGKTVLTNSLGQKTAYTHAIVGGEYRLLEARGAGCASCGEADVRYDYDRLGRLTEKTGLDEEGRPRHTLKTEYDGQGRAVKLSRIAWRDGKPQPARLIARYEYAGDAEQPVLIARPSVVPGKEHQIRVAYNDAGQITRVTETGFSPLDKAGESAATPLVRVTVYTYRTLNRRSVLAAIDGPLPNGPSSDPADSDVTRIEWDARGERIVGMSRPGESAAALTYDTAGRIIRVRNAEGFATAFRYDRAGRLASTESAGEDWARQGLAPVVESYRYDVLGNRIESGSGGAGGAPSRPRTRQAFDVAGRLLWQAEALGILKRASYDSEGKLLASTVQTRSFAQTERYRYDAQNRLVQVADSTDAVHNIVHAERPGIGQGRASAFRSLVDDFGREVLVASASHGILVRQYDAADRLVEQTGQDGNAQRYAYDLAGRRVRHTSVSGSGTEQTTTWRYVSGRLAEVSDPAQSEHIRYDARGLPATRTVTLKLANGAEAIHVTRYVHDADGRLIGESLPDGSKILYERNGQGQVVAVHRQTNPWTVFGWGRTTLVKDLERDLVGLRSLTYGNGIQGQWQRSREGVLARIVYTRPAGGAPDARHVAAAAQAAVRQSLAGGILDRLLPAAHAQTPPSAPDKLPGALGLPTNPLALFDARLLYDGAGNVILQRQQGRGPQRTLAYAYDRRSQLVAAQSAPRHPVRKTAAGDAASVWRYHYDARGNRVLAQENVAVSEMGHTRKATYDAVSDAMTAPQSGREYVWDAQGRLAAIRQQQSELARYRYNHQGLRVSKTAFAPAGEGGKTRTTHTLYNTARQRIAELDADGKITRQYLWLGEQLIATLDPARPKPLQAPADGFWQALRQSLDAVRNSFAGNADRIAFVHANHLGAPIAATDAAGETLWQAEHAPYGKLIRTSASSRKARYALALRLPGQWEDEESGLYYNDARYYDPHAGRYLSPDPLGRLAEVLGSPNAYAYVNNNPASYIDPWGLILFAFDGTNNSNLPLGVDDWSNVYKFYLAYDVSPMSANGDRKWYMNGIGRNDPDSGIQTNGLDQYNANTGRARVDYMLGQLDDYIKNKDVSDGNMISLDIVGFSRGAALARDFSNRVATWMRDKKWDGKTACIEIRFMGLWDTVAQFGVNGALNGLWQLAIPPEAKNVFHAVAVNENRYLFPGESIGRGTQRGFIGSHADIGGSYGTGDLSDVALNWIVDQAKASGVKMYNWGYDGTDQEWGMISNPVVHDKSNGIENSALCLRANNEIWATNCTSRRTANPGGLTATQVQNEKFIINRATPGLDADGSSPITGDVNMEEYAKWLKANYGLDIAVGP